MKIPSAIMIHHSGVSYFKNPDQFHANNRYHKQQWNFLSSMGFYLGYTYEINKLGFVRQARAFGEATAACYKEQMNDGHCIHVCLDGNFEIERPFPSEIYALRDLLRGLKKRFSILPESIFFHRQYSKTKCPGKNMDLEFVRGLISGTF